MGRQHRVSTRSSDLPTSRKDHAMIRHDDADLCARAGAATHAATQPAAQRLSRANTVISASPICVIALNDDISVPVPSSVTGLASASHWLERNFREAGTAAFYRAERVADHPHLICGGVYAPTTELAFLTRNAADERGGCRD